jgi:hypothetical protein
MHRKLAEKWFNHRASSTSRRVSLALIAALGAMTLTTHAADTYLSGTMTNITSGTPGLMLMLDTGVPTNCAGSPYGWMLIPEANKTMIATALMAWHSGNRVVTVYTNAAPSGSLCIVNQFDPA